MSYCRWSECDIYMYNDVAGGITCHTTEDQVLSFKTRSEAIVKLEELSKTMRVPKRILKRLREELAEIGETDGLEPAANYALEKTFLGMPLVVDPSLPANAVELRTEKQIIRGQTENGQTIITLLKARS